MRMYSVILNCFFNINMDDINTFVHMHDLIPHRNEVFSSDMDAMIYPLACQQPLLNCKLCTLGVHWISGSGRLQHYDSGWSSFVCKYV
jgi:hypothetical protein